MKAFLLILSTLAAAPISSAKDADDPAQSLRDIGARVFVSREGDATVVTEVSANNNAKLNDSHLAVIGRFEAVTDLSFEQTGITDAGLAHLKDLPKLEWLNLYRTKIGDAGLASLAEIASLKLLPIGGTKITDKGLAHLAKMPQLEYLGLRATAITDAGTAPMAGPGKSHRPAPRRDGGR